MPTSLIRSLGRAAPDAAPRCWASFCWSAGGSAGQRLARGLTGEGVKPARLSRQRQPGQWFFILIIRCLMLICASVSLVEVADESRGGRPRVWPSAAKIITLLTGFYLPLQPGPPRSSFTASRLKLAPFCIRWELDGRRSASPPLPGQHEAPNSYLNQSVLLCTFPGHLLGRPFSRDRGGWS